MGTQAEVWTLISDLGSWAEGLLEPKPRFKEVRLASKSRGRPVTLNTLMLQTLHSVRHWVWAFTQFLINPKRQGLLWAHWTGKLQLREEK